MSDYTHLNLKNDVDDQAPNFGLAPNLEFGTPLVVYCRDTVLARARAYARVDPDAVVVYGTKAFPNVALLRLLAGEGVGADVSTLGELQFAHAGGNHPIVFHGNN